MRRRLCAGLAVLALGCSKGGSLPLPRLPQVEQAQQSLQGGGRRYEDYRTCAHAHTDVPGVVACMQDAGYEFLPRSADEQASECWALREGRRPGGRLPDAWCFLHPPAH
jgi:hypothetical protein